MLDLGFFLLVVKRNMLIRQQSQRNIIQRSRRYCAGQKGNIQVRTKPKNKAKNQNVYYSGGQIDQGCDTNLERSVYAAEYTPGDKF